MLLTPALQLLLFPPQSLNSHSLLRLLLLVSLLGDGEHSVVQWQRQPAATRFRGPGVSMLCGIMEWCSMEQTFRRGMRSDGGHASQSVGGGILHIAVECSPFWGGRGWDLASIVRGQQVYSLQPLEGGQPCYTANNDCRDISDPFHSREWSSGWFR